MTSRSRTTIRWAVFVATVGLIVATTVPLLAATPAALEFRVVDAKTGEPLAGAVVALSRDGDAPGPVAARADARGIALFDGLVPGRFTADVSFPGYARTRLEAIRLGAGERPSFPVRMVPSLSETVIVADARPTVELEATSPSTRFTGEFLENLPVAGRSFQTMLTLAPGVQDPDGDGNPNVHGARERDFKVQVGEVSNQDPFTGLYLGYVNPDTIEELEVYAVGAGADYGRAQGGFARVVQKQGSNEFEGLFSGIFRSSKLDGNGASNTAEERIPDFNWVQPAIQIMGPIVRDHLWYRLSHEYQSIDKPINTLGGIAVTTHRQTIADDQLTWQITPRHKLVFRYLYDPFTDDNVNVSSIIPPESSVRDEFGGKTWSLAFTGTPSARFLFDGTVAYQDYGIGKGASQPGVNNGCVVGIDTIEAAQCLNTDGGSYSGSYNIDFEDDRQRLSVATKATHFFTSARGGSHQFRWGLGIENERFFRKTENRPFVNFSVLEGPPIIIPGQPTISSDVGHATVTFTLPPTFEQHGTSVASALWVEDQWKPTGNLVVTLGLRYDLEEVSGVGWEAFDPEQENREWRENRTGNPNIDRILLQDSFTAYEGLAGVVQGLSNALGFPISLTATSIQGQFWSKTRRPMNLNLRDAGLAPRLAVSWDPGGSGRTKLALNVGRYYDKTFLAIPVIETDPPTVSLLYTAERDAGVWRIHDPTGAINPALFVRTVRRDLRLPYSDEYALTFEQEIAEETVLRLVGIRRHFEDQFQDIDRNRAPGDFGRCARQINPRFDASLVSSPGSGFLVVDPNTGIPYEDTDPGVGDGRLDDCSGLLEPVPSDNPFGGNAFAARPDGVPDLYLQNPAWGTVLEVGNFNRARYSGVVLELIRRLHKNWQMEASYTWSRATGEAEDFLQSLGNDRSILDDESGYLSYDQRHVVKVNGTVVTPWGLRLGSALSWQSGLPYSVLSNRESVLTISPDLRGLLEAPDPLPRTIYPTGSRNDQRNRSYWNLDVRAAHEFRIKDGVNLGLTAEIFNLLNDGTYIVYNQALKSGRRLDGQDEAYRRFGRQFQVGFRLAF